MASSWPMDLLTSPPKPPAVSPEPSPARRMAASSLSPPSIEGAYLSLAESADQKLRLTDQEKKSNHIASEQKRRQAIRDGFDRLTEIVPDLENQGRSEGLVLRKTVEYIRKALEDRKKLMEEVKARGGRLPEGIRE